MDYANQKIEQLSADKTKLELRVRELEAALRAVAVTSTSKEAIRIARALV